MKAVFLITGGLFLAGICFVVYCCLCAASREDAWMEQAGGGTDDPEMQREGYTYIYSHSRSEFPMDLRSYCERSEQ